ncbi:hypothetical protein [Luteimonas sp. SDU101]|uniref:hypothetical protein n=1 Tax=Luteimonas sp. SDU101 TaxID=3422593 RepID=UPI003EBA5013
MTARVALERLLVRVRRRVLGDTLARWAPLPLALAALAWRVWGVDVAIATGVPGLLVVIAAGLRRQRRFDRAWLVARLDAARRDLEDSSGLLFLHDEALAPLQRLQRARLEQRLRERPAPDLRPPWSMRAIALAWALLAAACLVLALWPVSSSSPARVPPVADGATAVEAPRLVAQSLRVRPPAYTGQDASALQSLDAEVAVGSTLRWRLRFAPQPDSVALVFHDGERLALQREGEEWTTSLVLKASTLYRVVPAGAGDAGASPLHRLDAVPDLPPRVRVLAPERGLTLLSPGQDRWPLRFEAMDDHGVAPSARLLLTRTEGTGENIRFHEHVRVLQGRGDARSRRFELDLRPSDFGLQRGEDLVARLEVLDNRAPQPQLSRSASVILRWPPEPVLGAEGLDGLARQILPAYFRSQRQIIIDAEALLRERPGLAATEFERRSDLLGVDQRLLRLRYGQFLGEESEGGSAPPTNDLPTSDLPTNDAPAAAADAHGDKHDHDHEPPAPGAPAPAGFGNVGDVLEEFGHTHDIAEAATLLDPETRETLRSALREMWQSELHLRQAAPDQALPYAHRALELIKQVQQAERIYLQRVGTQLPPIDETRRLGGDRSALRNRALPPLAEAGIEPALSNAWRSLDAAADDTLPATLDALQAWTEANRDRLEDPLAWIAAIDALRQQPGCADCRDALRGLVWSALPRPAGAFGRRDGDAAGRRYLEALDQGPETP